MFQDVANLIYYSPEEKQIEVYVSKKSVARQEFYASYQIGVNPTCVFELRIEDFEMTRTIEKETNKPLYATRIVYDGAMYDIIRTYQKPNGMIELTCS